jgi:hypothetical protein
MIKKAADLDAQLVDQNDGSLCHLDLGGIMKQVHNTIDLARSRHMHRAIGTTNHLYGQHGSVVRSWPDSISDGFKHFKYQEWFEQKDLSRKAPPVMFNVEGVANIRVLARFRCGMHWLATEKQHHILRSQRVCVCCSAGEREDELHVMLCPAYAQAREQCPIVFRSTGFLNLLEATAENSKDIDRCLLELMTNAEPIFVDSLVGYLRKSIRIRDSIIASLPAQS